jgi:hypothetical protein
MVEDYGLGRTTCILRDLCDLSNEQVIQPEAIRIAKSLTCPIQTMGHYQH